MIDYETFCKIRDHHDRQGLTIAQTARALGVHPQTVAKWVKCVRFEARASAPRASRLDAFKDQVVRLLESHPYSAQQIFQRLQEAGYGGGLTILKDYVSKVRPVRREAFLKLAFAPGECAQVDWGEYGSIAVGSTRRRLSFFVLVLAHSRRLYVQFTVSQTMEHFLACHEQAFAAMAGVPAKIMVDNLKSAVGSDNHPGRSCCLTKECYSRLGCRYRSSECQSPRVGFDFQIALSVFRGCGGRPPRPKHHREVRSLYHGNTTGSA